MQKHKNDWTCTGEHCSLFVIRHVGTARLDSLDKVERVESCRVESRRAKWNWAYQTSECTSPALAFSVWLRILLAVSSHRRLKLLSVPVWPVLASIAARRQLRSPQASISWYRQPVAHQLETVRLPFQVQERGTVYTASPPLNLQIVLFLQKRT